MTTLRVLGETEFLYETEYNRALPIFLPIPRKLLYSLAASNIEMIRAGQVGRPVSSYETRWDEKGRTMISHIFVSFNELITSIQFGYLEDGAIVLSGMHGPSYPQRSFRAVTLNQDEYVTGLSGISGPSGGIINLTFHTNRGKHGPIGCSGDKFGASCSKIEIEPAIRDRREFGGFFGTYNGNNLSSIGIYVSPIARSDTVVKREKR